MCIHTGSCSLLAWTNALLKSMEQAFQFRVRDKTRNRRTELQATTGANVSGSPSSKSPRGQYRALNLLISPSSVRFRQKTQVHGSILVLAFDLATSIHVQFFLRIFIFFLAAFIHLSTFCGVSVIALSYDSVSGSEDLAFRAKGDGRSPHSRKSHALGSTMYPLPFCPSYPRRFGAEQCLAV